MTKRMAKLRDIAKKADCSISTVSRALRDGSDLSAETVRAIRAAADELGYRWRHLNGDSSRAIGVILPEVRSHYFAELAHSLTHELEKCGYKMMLLLSGFHAEGMWAAYDHLLKTGVSGILVNDYEPQASGLVEYVLEGRLPTVLIAETTEPQQVDTIYVDSKTCMRLAVEHLMDLGHRRFGYVGEHHSELRHKALCAVLEEHGLAMDPRHVKVGKERFEVGGYLRCQELLQEEDLPTAIIACYDQVALGAQRALREAGLSVPQDVSVIGVDDVVINDYLPAGLTSITNPAEQLGVVAVKLLMSCINEGEKHVVQNVAMQSRLVTRSSTAPPRAQ